MRLPRRLVTAGGTLAVGALPFALAVPPADALDGDEYASVTWVQTFEDPSGAVISCSLFAEAEVNRDDESFSAVAQLRVVDDDPGCQDPFVQLTLSSTDSSGDPQEARSASFGSTQVTLTATDVAENVTAAVFVAFPNCRPTSAGCASERELHPK
jgi:hypothetical protein